MAICLATGITAALSRSFMEMNTVPDRGRRWLAPRAALAKALPKSTSIPITSPVERISGPSRASVPANLSKGSTASLTAMCLGITSSVKPSSARVLPDMTRTASLARGWPIAFETKGTVLEARGLASMM